MATAVLARWCLVPAACLAATASCSVDHRSLGEVWIDPEDTTSEVEWRPTNLADVLFLVDNSGSMAQEQAALALAFPSFLETFFAEAEARGIDASLNVGVISTDLGTMGRTLATCDDPVDGDDGCLLHLPSATVAGCEAEYPAFLSRAAGDAYPLDRLAGDFGCIATLGTRGCGFEQHFGALCKALIDHTAPGGCNEGFVRGSYAAVDGGPAVITPGVTAVIVVSDEDDCTVRATHPEMFDPERTDLGHVNVRCFAHPEFVTTLEETEAALRGFAGEGHYLVLGALVGVPPDEPACNGPGDALDGCLAVPAMIERVDPAVPSQLLPSCNTAAGLASPPRRIVELVRRFGADGYVASICTTDYGEPLRAVALRILAHLD
ncbi:MAG: hypothetical protein JXB32_21610 [Deltaproteobacteria bacterium]|nr:hypothetical protein [Deltaproteobacteria bacterium]